MSFIRLTNQDNAPVLINTELVRAVGTVHPMGRPSPTRLTMIEFDNDHRITVAEPFDDVAQKLSFAGRQIPDALDAQAGALQGITEHLTALVDTAAYLVNSRP